ncbi:MAG TPA: hypothetical protein VK668_09060 [Mucilaginibacter sp.]|nr:hypothetical protein [Mucilaginibacter sp.]
MKKIITLVIAVLLAATFVHAQEGWVTHKGDNRISVKFPAEPSEVIAGTFAAKDKDSVVYVFTIVDFVQVAGIDSTALAPLKATPEFATQLKTGISQSLPDVQMEDFKIGTWKGFTSYTSTGVDSKKKQYDMFLFIIGNKLYSASTIIANGGSLEGRDIFLKSIRLSN